MSSAENKLRVVNSPRLVRVLGSLIIIAAIAGVVELGSYLVVSYLSHVPQTKLLLYRPPSIPAAEYEAYLKRRDPRLGWPPPEQIGGEFYDSSGSRRTPVFPEPGGECVTLYGDSFTYASDVSDEEAWPNLLSRLLNCRVGNFGVGGYGTDQAYLRFEYNATDRAAITILGIHPTDAIRNLTRNAYLALGGYPTSFKPRFALSDGKLVLLPMPTVPTGRLTDFARHPEQFLQEDMVLPGTRDGPVRIEFPFSLTVLSVASRPSVRNWLLGRPSWFNLYVPGDASTGLEVMEGVLEKFAALCSRRGKQCAVLLFPAPNSHAYFRKTGHSPMASLHRNREHGGVRFLDLTPAFARAVAGGQFCDLAGAEGCSGHFNARGNELVARLVYQFLTESPAMRMAPPKPASGGAVRAPPDVPVKK